MRRITISMDDDLADLFDKFMEGKGYTSRSEAIRDLLRGEIQRDGIEAGSARECVGALSYVYNHHERQLASRLASLHHDHHDITVATTHAHLDHDHCIETVILRGKTEVVTRFAECVIAEKGVRHGKFNAIPVETDTHTHSHGPGKGHQHRHVRPCT
jgi:CopG family transcriptional regulator, nickel-responsive regulator